MSKNALFSDTFDNISFSEIGSILNNRHESFTKPSTSFDVNDRKHSGNGGLNGKNVISFDDSQFFAESFNVSYSSKSNCNVTASTDSEDLFGDSLSDLDFVSI